MTKPSIINNLRETRLRTWISIFTLVLVVAITALYRFYQPVTHPALLQFDIFDWMNRSRELILFGKMTALTTLWVFPTFNAWVARLFDGDLFSVYLYSGAVLTTLNVVLLAMSARLLWPKRVFPTVILILFYGLNTQLLARSVNYLPETMTYSFGLALVYCYLCLFLRRSWQVIPVILILSYLFYHLHQSGLNFFAFTALVLFSYVVWLVPLRKRWRTLIISGCFGVLAGLLAIVTALRQQFIYFLQGSKNVDTAFQGEAIPIQQIVSDYPLPFVAFLGIGVYLILLKTFRKNTRGVRLSYVMLLGIATFYFAFLYVLPNAGLYSLIPWRFYTWFSLYGIFVATVGGVAFFDRFRLQRGIIVTSLLLISFTMFHGSLISDNMFTADKSTLRDIKNITIPEGVVITTNANYLQTRYALAEQRTYVTYHGPEIFNIKDPALTRDTLRGLYGQQDIFILVSLYQLRQKPSSIDYWNNSAQTQMDTSVFQNPDTFEIVKKTPNILLVKLRS